MCADAIRLPLADTSTDLVFSNLMLQWCADPEAVFRECSRVLRPGGLLTFTSFGPDTLKELRAPGRPPMDTRTSIALSTCTTWAMRCCAGLAEPVMDVELYTLTYPDVGGLMRDPQSHRRAQRKRGARPRPDRPASPRAHDGGL